MADQMRELKPCPFCGSASLTYEYIERIGCLCCGATVIFDDRQGRGAIALWNARAALAAIPEVSAVQAAAEPVATVKITDAGYAQLWVHGICIKSLYGEVGRDAMDTLAARLNHATAQPVQAAALDSAMGHQTERDGEAVQRPLRGIER
jgi:hypothetical protein